MDFMGGPGGGMGGGPGGFTDPANYIYTSDLTMYEQSAQPLENLANFAGYFLIVILLIGAIILIVLNVFATREKKYEIGVLSAIGMKKAKIAKLFLTEILAYRIAEKRFQQIDL